MQVQLVKQAHYFSSVTDRVLIPNYSSSVCWQKNPVSFCPNLPCSRMPVGVNDRKPAIHDLGLYSWSPFPRRSKTNLNGQNFKLPIFTKQLWRQISATAEDHLRCFFVDRGVPAELSVFTSRILCRRFPSIAQRSKIPSSKSSASNNKNHCCSPIIYFLHAPQYRFSSALSWQHIKYFPLSLPRPDRLCLPLNQNHLAPRRKDRQIAHQLPCPYSSGIHERCYLA